MVCCLKVEASFCSKSIYNALRFPKIFAPSTALPAALARTSRQRSPVFPQNSESLTGTTTNTPQTKPKSPAKPKENRNHTKQTQNANPTTQEKRYAMLCRLLQILQTKTSAELQGPVSAWPSSARPTWLWSDFLRKPKENPHGKTCSPSLAMFGEKQKVCQLPR